jgi:chromosome segregation ATPase
MSSTTIAIEATDLARLLQRVDGDALRMATLEARVEAMERGDAHSRASSRRAVSPKVEPRGDVWKSASTAQSRPPHSAASESGSPDAGLPAHLSTSRYDDWRSGSEYPSMVSHRAHANGASVDSHYRSHADSSQQLRAAKSNSSTSETILQRELRWKDEELARRDVLIDTLRGELSDAVRESEELRRLHEAECGAHAATVDSLKRQVTSLRDAIEATTAADAEAALDGSSPSALFQREMRAKNELVASLREELEEVRTRQAAAIQAELRAVQEDMDALRGDSERKLVAHRREIAQLEEHVALKQSQVSLLEQRLQQKDEALTATERQLTDAARAVARFEATEASLKSAADRLREDVRAAMEAHDHAEAKCESLKNELVAANRRTVTDASAALQARADRDATRAKLETAENRNAELQRAVDAEHVITMSLRRDVAEAREAARNQQAKAEATAAEVAVLKAAARDSETAVASLKKELNEAYEAAERFNRDRVEATRKLEEAQLLTSRRQSSTGGGASSSAAALEEQLSSVTFSRDMLTREVATLRKQLESKDLEAETEAAQRRSAPPSESAAALRIVRDENAALRQEVARLSGEWDKARDDVLRLQQRLRAQK